MKARTYILDGRPIPVTISHAAIEEWLTVRAANRKAGYPDRPPDVDAPQARAWRPHPGDPGYRQEPDVGDSFEVLTSTVRGQAGTKLVGQKREESPDRVLVKVRSQQSDGGYATRSTRDVDDQKWSEMKADFIAIVEARGGTVSYMGPQAFHEIDDVGAEVDAAITEWYRERAGVDESHSGV